MIFIFSKTLIKKHLKLECEARWAVCIGCPLSKMWMRYPLSNGTAMIKVSLGSFKEPLAYLYYYYYHHHHHPLSSRANELLAMSKLRHRAAVGLLKGHTTLRA
jgi:hypothetical protein